MSTGRNDPCPCGSGKKYKHCCAGRDLSAAVSRTATLFAEAQQHLQAGRDPEAEALYQRILAINPRHADARHYLGMAMCLRGDFPSGFEQLHAALALQPEDAIYHNNLAIWLEAAGNLADAVQHLRRALDIKPGYREARLGLARLQLRRARYDQARTHLRELVRTDPADQESRRLLAEAYEQLGEYSSMQQEYRELLVREPRNAGLRLGYAEKLMMLGRDDEALVECETTLTFAPDQVEAMKLCVYTEERRGRLDEAERWAQAALAQAPQDGGAQRLMARVRRRRGDLAGALGWMEQVDLSSLTLPEQSRHWFELGTILDKQASHVAAFEAFRRANEAARAVMERVGGERCYDREQVRRGFASRRRFFTSERVAGLAPYAPPAAVPAPLFITGFPRSGTTLTEQMLGMHPNIHAGGELIGMNILEASAAARLRSASPYPDCLAAVLEPDGHGRLRELRDVYLALAREAGAMAPQVKYFTDKQPFNETRLGLIRLLFPESPVVHVIRHPLDVVLSNYFNELRHGHAFDIENLAFHYAQVMQLVEQQVALPGVRTARLRYEDLLRDPEAELRRLLDFIGAPWDPRCLDFHRSGRVARTLSYAQVSQSLYTSSVGRWRHYREQLAPAIPLLAPVIERLGYTLA